MNGQNFAEKAEFLQIITDRNAKNSAFQLINFDS